MKLHKLFFFFFVFFVFGSTNIKANLINATATNYTGFLGMLLPGDTLNLSAGIYTNNIILKGINGTSAQPIVITGNGNTTKFQGQAGYNTISITQCSYLIIKNLQLDGRNLFIDAVKAEGTEGNWAHHITIECLYIINYGADQQNVGISTKCASWDWIIRKNIIIGAGTGMYLGNSSGEDPFVNGIIEYNYVANTIGYNIEIKHQLDTVRDNFPGTSVNGKTIIRHNVLTKDLSSSTGGSARPNLLVGGFPLSGWGATDFYEIYGNFFYNNPVEALFQGTGNIMLYENIFVNHFDPSGFRAVYFVPQNGVRPQNIKVFHNTVWVLNSAGGIRIFNPDPGYQQYCYGNAVFAPVPITNFTNSLDNFTDSYSNAGTYVLSADSNIALLNLYPKNGQLKGTLTPKTLFQNITSYDMDFNGDTYDWTYRGSYSGCCINKGWQLQLDTMPSQASTPLQVLLLNRNSEIDIYPNPVSGWLHVINRQFSPLEIEIHTISGKTIYKSVIVSSQTSIDLSGKPNGVYYMITKSGNNIFSRKIIKQ